MCGINGYIRKNRNAEAALPRISRMNRQLKHRGPDSEGACFLMPEGQRFSDVRLDDTAAGAFPQHLQITEATLITDQAIAAMGHRRLSIVDLSQNAHQPMADETGRYRLIFNGEIFNFRELKHQLQSKGVRFFSHSDTEVLLKGWMEEGPAFLSRINGFFAGCIADAKEGTWTLFRDSPGVKPLFYLDTPDFFAFSSETKVLRELQQQVHINPQQAATFLTYGRTLNTHRDTWFQDIYALEPGSVLQIRLQDAELHHEKLISHQGNRLSETLQTVLRRSVQQRIEAEVPVGFAASGGLDSSLILGVAASLFPKQVPGMLAFSATSSDPNVDESEWQRQIAGFTGVKRIEVSIGAQDARLIPQLVAAADLPAAAWNNLAHYRLCTAANAHGIKVMLNGQGADELFAGYPAYLPAWFRDVGWKQRKEFLLHLANSGLNTVEWMKLRLKDGLQRRLGADRWQLRALRRKSFTSFVHADLFESLPEPILPDALLDGRLKDDYYGMKLGQMLQWEDRNSMAHSVESRNPFADDQILAQMAWSIPSENKIRNGFTKYPLRELSQAYIPESISWRKDKKGFSMPDAALTAEALPFMLSWIDALPECGVHKTALLKLEGHTLERDATLAGFVFRCATYSVFLQHIKS
ncbi:MAG: asparagine synthase (glutamine-hydrolyzing) [Bacteroidetes bacterium]|nr:asparagine synthase (glutamine-hydrolyzing) [Bacteroidota bacterium]